VPLFFSNSIYNNIYFFKCAINLTEGDFKFIKGEK